MLIYKITNKINGKIYIGQTIKKLKTRWKKHKESCLSNRNNFAIYSAMRKYGIKNFTIEEIDGANNQSELNYKEWLLIHKLNSLVPNGYNLREGGNGRGRWHSLSIEKLRESNLGKKASKETKEKQSKIRSKLWKNKEYRGKLEKHLKNLFNNEKVKNKHKIAQNKRWNSKNREKSSLSHGGKFFIVLDKITGSALWEGVNMTDCADFLKISKGNIPQYLKNKKNSKKYIFNYKGNL